ncbi:hypothetical protein [Bacillus thuringiensis]|uniref:hypothetical protein n=1 Tax=Bacillus thuringiensis TaxID=1428 RepID=UPI0021D652BF|nr:hypothetical protein [Bacillus thuringiensis]MCU7667200.1 hypothetical protein [Bacillus thuringiensis]
MSIKAFAKKIVEEAKDYMVAKYENDEGFKIQIGQKSIKISTYKGIIELKRWHEGEKNHHFYSVFESRYARYQSPEGKERDIVIDGFEFVFKYLKEYATFKKQDGFIVVQEKEHEVSKEIFELLREVDKSKLITDEKDHAAYALNYYAETYLGGVISEKLESSIKQLYCTARNIKRVIDEKPLCVINQSVYDVMRSGITLKYHGEEILISCLEKNNEIRVKLSNLNKTISFSNTMREEQLKETLSIVEEENKFQNLVNPNPLFFGKFIKERIPVKQSVIEEEFKSLVSYFNEEWENVELLFRDLLERELLDLNSNKEFVNMFMKLKDSESGHEFMGYTFDSDENTFWIAVHTMLDDKYSKTMKIFVSEKGEESKKVEEYMNDFVRNMMKINLEKLR